MVKKRVRKITARQLAVQSARIAHDRHGENIVVLDLRGISPVADYFVIFTGTSDRQMSAVADEIADAAAKAGHKPFHVAGRESGQWLLLDFFDVVVHIFDEVHRRYYDLELIWGDAPRIRWKKQKQK
ncbi:MAG: ribosome silencing factor [Planctomycetota bacterium]|nr:ribosome silencing factor [Planctomycetota bacterium]